MNETTEAALENDLLARAHDRDAGACAELARRHAPLAKRTALVWGAGDDADDIVQAALVKALTRLDTLRSGVPFGPWLARIVINETKNLHRERARRSTREETWTMTALLTTDPVPEPDTTLDRAVALTLATPTPTRSERVRLRVAGFVRRARRKLIALMIMVVAIGVGVAPPVRASIAQWLEAGGVLIMSTPSEPATLPPTTAPSLPGEIEVTLDRAAELVDFPVRAPRGLGAPDRVTVSGDRRVVGMTWHTTPWGAVHLDQFDGRLSYGFVKQSWNEITHTQVGESDAFWLDQPHVLIFVNADGAEQTESARLAGRTLIFEAPQGSQVVTYRLEGELIMKDAVALMEDLS